MECMAIKCIRIARDKNDLAGFSIERTCRYKDNECKYKRPASQRDQTNYKNIDKESSSAPASAIV